MKGNRYRIYEAEDESGINDGWYTTLDGMQAWFDWVVRTKFWRENSPIRHLRAKYPIVNGMSGATRFSGNGENRVAEVAFGVFSLCLGVACHELTHLLKGLYKEDQPDERDHDKLFATSELRVVKRFMGIKMARKLEEAFKDHKVEYSEDWNA